MQLGHIFCILPLAGLTLFLFELYRIFPLENTIEHSEWIVAGLELIFIVGTWMTVGKASTMTHSAAVISSTWLLSLLLSDALSSSTQPWALIYTLSWLIHAWFIIRLYQYFRQFPNHINLAAWGIIAGAYLFLFFLIVRAINLDDPYTYNWVHATPDFRNIRFPTQLIPAAIILSLLPWIEPRFDKTAYRYLSSIVLILGATFLFWSGSRGALLGIIASWITLFILFGKKIYPISLILLISSISGFLFAKQFPTIQSTNIGITHVLVTEGNIEQISSFRISTWKLALSGIQNSPYLGNGSDFFETLHSKSFPARLTTSHPHNSLLQMATNWGIPATLLFFIMVARVLFDSINHCRKSKSLDSTTLALWATLSFLTHSLVSGNLFYPRPIAMFCILFAILLTATYPNKLGKAESARPSS